MEIRKRVVLIVKGLIIVDKIPNNCRNISGEEDIGCPFGGMVCQITQKDVMSHVVYGTKPDWCPIKEMPSRKQVPGCFFMMDEVYGKEIGFNDCLDEIEGR